MFTVYVRHYYRFRNCRWERVRQHYRRPWGSVRARRHAYLWYR